ncbi:hypothetical protein [Aliikangiella maris]|uniref:Uncharacterized protein n=2 Tax=Aliikangiella maris TaxID=3162458 RepID=A0ABV3MNJ6_9GAMM
MISKNQMTSKNTFLLLFLSINAFFSTLAIALEPLKENRARISSMQATLLLPDYSTLNVNMSFDCGSRYENTGMIVSSLAGAQLLAAAYTHLWGDEAGEMVMQLWQNKADKDDPRLPTFLIISPESGAQFDWKQTISATSSLNKLRSNNMVTQSSSSGQTMPTPTAGCGRKDH